MLILSIITAVLLVSIFIFYVIGYDELMNVSMALLLLLGIFGWFLYGLGSIKSVYVTKENVEVVKSKSFIIVKFGNDHIEKYEKITDFNEINDSTIFYKVECNNMYGGTCLFTPYIYIYNNSKNSFLYNNTNKKLIYNDLEQMVK